MIKEIKERILQLFRNTSSLQVEDRGSFTSEYEVATDLNLTAIFANKLATLAVCDSGITVNGNNKRSMVLQDAVSKLWAQSKKLTSRVIGTGGVVVIPYVVQGKLYFDIVSQDRININAHLGDEIYSATILADIAVINKQNYYRWMDYDLVENTLVVRCTATYNGNVIPLASVEKWANIPAETVIKNVKQLPFAFIKSPIDNRKQSNLYGVPITYGTKNLQGQIQESLKQINEEFQDKKAVIFMDDRLIPKDEQGDRKPKNKLIRLVKGSGDNKNSLIDIFDPSIRDSSYYNHLQHLFELFEKAVGTSAGILTEQSVGNASLTATEVKRGSYDTFAIVNDIRKKIGRAHV